MFVSKRRHEALRQRCDYLEGRLEVLAGRIDHARLGTRMEVSETIKGHGGHEIPVLVDTSDVVAQIVDYLGLEVVKRPPAEQSVDLKPKSDFDAPQER